MLYIPLRANLRFISIANLFYIGLNPFSQLHLSKLESQIKFLLLVLFYLMSLKAKSLGNYSP